MCREGEYTLVSGDAKLLRCLLWYYQIHEEYILCRALHAQFLGKLCAVEGKLYCDRNDSVSLLLYNFLIFWFSNKAIGTYIYHINRAILGQILAKGMLQY